MLAVVVAAGLADPPGRLVARLAEFRQDLEHPAPPGVRLDPRHVPRLALHRREEDRIERVDVDLVALVGTRDEPFQLAGGLRQPRAEMGDGVSAAL